MQKTLFTLLAAVVLGTAATASAVIVPGGGKKADCYGVFDVESDTLCKTSQNKAEAIPANGQCVFTVSACTNGEVTGCSPANVTSVKTKGVPAPTPAGVSNVCSPTPATITILLSGKKKSRSKTVKMTTKTSDGRPKTDKDQMKLFCRRTCAGGGGKVCAKNPQGGPDQIQLVVGETDTDLDNGWTGISMNFPTPPNSRIDLCMSECDDSTDPTCTLNGPVGADSLNGRTFGPPLPLLASNVPVCVINRYQGPMTGTFDMTTGEASIQVNLFSDVYFTDPAKVCPRCTGGSKVGDSGTCDGGQNAGKACTIESILRVAQSTAQNKNFELSRDCPPTVTTPDGTLDIRLPLTTGTSGPLQGGGAIPCGQEPQNSKAVQAKDNDCTGTCVEGNCTGLACVTKNAEGICIDDKGGLSQMCCSNRTNLPCHPVGITRTGKPGIPQPAWPDPTYPKTGPGTMGAVFCESATDNFLVNTSTGLPGPGALLLPGTNTVRKLE
jgi:hypothetical protein